MNLSYLASCCLRQLFQEACHCIFLICFSLLLGVKMIFSSYEKCSFLFAEWVFLFMDRTSEVVHGCSQDLSGNAFLWEWAQWWQWLWPEIYLLAKWDTAAHRKKDSKAPFFHLRLHSTSHCIVCIVLALGFFFPHYMSDSEIRSSSFFWGFFFWAKDGTCSRSQLCFTEKLITFQVCLHIGRPMQKL